MIYLLILKAFFFVDMQYNYDKLLYLIAEKESRFQCQIIDPYNVTYGKYQVMPSLAQKMGYQFPLSCEKQDEMMMKLVRMYEELIDIKKYEFKYHKGILLHRTNLIVAMHFAPHGTIRYLETGVDFSNGILSVSGLLKRYEKDTFYELK